MAIQPYIKSGCDDPPQQVQLTKNERIYFKMYDADDALIAAFPTASAIVTFKDQDGTVITVAGPTQLEDVALTADGTGIYYYEITLLVTETAKVIYAFPSATLDGMPTTMDVGIAILVRAEEAVPTSENYCTVEDVASFTGRDFQTNSQPTRNEVQEQIDFICGQINDYLRYQYDTPITGTRALAQLKMIAKVGTAAMVEGSIPRGREMFATMWKKMYDQYLKEIKAGTLPLTTTSDEASQIAEPNLSNLIGGLGDDTDIEDEDKEHHFDIADLW